VNIFSLFLFWEGGSWNSAPSLASDGIKAKGAEEDARAPDRIWFQIFLTFGSHKTEQAHLTKLKGLCEFLTHTEHNVTELKGVPSRARFLSVCEFFLYWLMHHVCPRHRSSIYSTRHLSSERRVWGIHGTSPRMTSIHLVTIAS